MGKVSDSTITTYDWTDTSGNRNRGTIVTPNKPNKFASEVARGANPNANWVKEYNGYFYYSPRDYYRAQSTKYAPAGNRDKVIEPSKQQTKQEIEQQKKQQEQEIKKAQKSLARKKVGPVERIEQRTDVYGKPITVYVGPKGEYVFEKGKVTTTGVDKPGGTPSKEAPGRTVYQVQQEGKPTRLITEEKFIKEYQVEGQKRAEETYQKVLAKEAEQRAKAPIEIKQQTVIPKQAYSSNKPYETKSSFLDVNQFFPQPEFKPEIPKEVATGIREQLSQKQIQQTQGAGEFGKKVYLTPSISYDYDPIDNFVKGVKGLTIEPVQSFYRFYDRYGKATVDVGGELYYLSRAKTEKEKKNIKGNILNIGAETFLNQDAVQALSITAFAASPALVQKIAVTAFGFGEVKGFVEKPTFEGVGRLTTFYAIIKAPKVFEQIKKDYIAGREAAFSARMNAQIKTGPKYENVLEPTIERTIVDPRTGQVTKQYSGFKLKHDLVSKEFAVVGDTGRIVQVNQRVFEPKPLLLTTDTTINTPFRIIQKDIIPADSLFLSGLGYKTPTSKFIDIDFLPAKPTQTKVPEFLFKTESKPITFPIESGEYAGIDYPLGKESRLIRFKPQKNLGTSEAKFPAKIKQEFQQSLGLYTGKIIPLPYEGVAYTPAELKARKIRFESLKNQYELAAKQFPEPKTAPPKPIEVSTGQSSLILEQPKTESLRAKDLFAGDVKFKGSAQQLFPESSASASDVVYTPPRGPTYFGPIAIPGMERFNEANRMGDVVRGRFKEKERMIESTIPVIMPDIKVGQGNEIFFKQQPRIKTGIDQSLAPRTITFPDIRSDLGQPQITQPETKIDTNIVPIIDTRLDIVSRLEDIDIPKPREPPKPPEEIEEPEIPVPRFKLDYDSSPFNKSSVGYDAYVKERGKNVKVNKKPLPRNVALNLAFDAADNTPARTAFIKESGKTDKPDGMLNSFLANKFYKKGKKFIEKTDFAIDSPGEIRGITVKGWLANKRKGGFNFRL